MNAHNYHKTSTMHIILNLASCYLQKTSAYLKIAIAIIHPVCTLVTVRMDKSRMAQLSGDQVTFTDVEHTESVCIAKREIKSSHRKGVYA